MTKDADHTSSEMNGPALARGQKLARLIDTDQSGEMESAGLQFTRWINKHKLGQTIADFLSA